MLIFMVDQFIMCLIVLLLIWFSFQKPPPYWKRYLHGYAFILQVHC